MSSEIQVLLINLARRPDRLAGMTAHLHEIGVPFERLEAVDGTTCAPSALAHLPQAGPIGQMSPGTRACTASHFRALARFLAGPAGFALILEDDVEILPDLAALVADDGWLAGKADIVKLEKFIPERPSKLLLGPVLGFAPDGTSGFRPMYSRHTGAAGYIISRHGAQTALSFASEINVPIDHFLFNETVSPLFRKLRPAILVQPVLWQTEAIGAGSSITTAVQGETSWAARKRRSVMRALMDMRLVVWQVFLLATRRAEMVEIHTPMSKGSAPPKILRRFLRS